MVDTNVLNGGDLIQVAEADKIYLDEIPVPVGSIIESFTSRFESKVTIGDYTKDSDQLLSTWVISNPAGGALIDQHQEGATDSRFRWACAWTMSAEQLALPPKHDVLSFGAAVVSGDADARGPISVPLIEIKGVLYVAMGKELWKVTADTLSYTNVTYTKIADLPGYAQGAAVIDSSRDHFWIPLGDDGVQLVRSHTHATLPDTLATLETDVKAISMCRWDGKPFALTLDGYLRVCVAGVWEPSVPTMQISDDGLPRSCHVFFDRTGESAVYVVTSRNMYGYDRETDKLYMSTLHWPKHPGNGIGATVWRDDAMYISSGYAVTRYTRDGVRTDMGLDRDDGIPSEKVHAPWGELYGPFSPAEWIARPGRSISTMAGGQNFIAAAVQLGKDQDGTFPYAIVAWNESGWHVLAEETLAYQEGTGAGRYPTSMLVTETVGGYRLWWGEGAVEHVGGAGDSAYLGVPRLHSIEIPRAFHGPRQKVLDNLTEFEQVGYYESGWFDAAMRGFKKTWSHVEVYLTDPQDGLPLSGSVTISYRTDAAPDTWIVLGTVSAYGRTVLPFNVEGTGFPRGAVSTAIELRVNMTTSAPHRSPIINSILLKFQKLALPGRAWQLSVPFEGEEINGVGPNELSAFLARRTYEGGFSWFRISNRSYRVGISQVQVVRGTGDVPNRTIQVNMIEVPISGDPVWGGDEIG